MALNLLFSSDLDAFSLFFLASLATAVFPLDDKNTG
jgi:hypothetical protein